MLNNLGNALRSLRRLDEALTAYRAAIASDPAYPEAHWNLSLTLLLMGDFPNGWPQHQWRFRCSSLDRPQAFDQPQWLGEPLENRSILLHAEQGLGDSIQFVRYAPLVAAKGATVILQCQPELIRLFKTIPGVSQVIARGQPLPPFQLQCPLMSLPLAFSTQSDSIPAMTPYLSAPVSPPDPWEQRLRSATKPLKVGLVWAGSTTQRGLQKRSVRLDQLDSFIALDGIQFVSLQMGAESRQLSSLATHGDILNFENEINDLADTAGIISKLDLVITVDTSVAHLAGAMGKPVWVMLHFDADWRWLLDRNDSPWYPTMRLFRQTTADDWKPVITQIRQALAQLPK